MSVIAAPICLHLIERFLISSDELLSPNYDRSTVGVGMAIRLLSNYCCLPQMMVYEQCLAQFLRVRVG